MVKERVPLSEEKKKELLERLRLGREKKKLSKGLSSNPLKPPKESDEVFTEPVNEPVNEPVIEEPKQEVNKQELGVKGGRKTPLKERKPRPPRIDKNETRFNQLNSKIDFLNENLNKHFITQSNRIERQNTTQVLEEPKQEIKDQEKASNTIVQQKYVPPLVNKVQNPYIRRSTFNAPPW